MAMRHGQDHIERLYRRLPRIFRSIGKLSEARLSRKGSRRSGVLLVSLQTEQYIFRLRQPALQILMRSWQG